MAWTNFLLGWPIFSIKMGSAHFPKVMARNISIIFQFCFCEVATSGCHDAWRLGRFQQCSQLISGGFQWVYSSTHPQGPGIRGLCCYNHSIDQFIPIWLFAALGPGDLKEDNLNYFVRLRGARYRSWGVSFLSQTSTNFPKFAKMFWSTVLVYNENPPPPPLLVLSSAYTIAFNDTHFIHHSFNIRKVSFPSEKP